MTIEWLLGSLLAGVLLGFAALEVERAAGWLGLPRRWGWAAAVAGSLLLPLLALAAPGALPDVRLPAWRSAAASPSPDMPGGATPAATDASASIQSAAVSTSPRPLPRAALPAWLMASLTALSAFGWSYARLRRLRDGCPFAPVEGGWVRVSERAGPMVVGIVDPEVILPRWVLDSPAEERRLVVRHEREHVASGDARLLALSALAVALMPWNPAIWWQHRRLRLAVETDCDARVLAAGASRGLYGAVLLRTAAHPSAISGLALALGERASHLERRIVAMTASAPPHRLPRALALLALAAAVALGACGALAGGHPARATASSAGAGTIRLDTVDAREIASMEWSDGYGVALVRPPADEGQSGLSLSWGPGISMRGGEPRPAPARSPVVVRVESWSPAARAGVREDDVVLAINGRDPRDRRAPPPAGASRVGAPYTLRVLRGGREMGFAFALEERPWPPAEEDFRDARRTSRAAERRHAKP